MFPTHSIKLTILYTLYVKETTDTQKGQKIISESVNSIHLGKKSISLTHTHTLLRTDGKSVLPVV